MKKLVNPLVLILLIFSLMGFSKILKSYKEQRFTLSDMNSDNWSRPWEFIENLEVDFPNLTATAVPLKAIQAQYYIYNDSVIKGMNLIDEVISENTNPFIMLPEALKAKYFNTLGWKDSAYVYSRKAFSGLPRNPFHLAELIRSLNADQKKDSIVEYFKPIKYPFNEQVWRIFLTSSIGDSINSFTKDTALEALKLTQNKNRKNDLLRMTSFIYLYGQDNFKKALEIEANAANFLKNEQFEDAKNLYEQLKSLIPTNYIYKEHLGVCYFNLKDYSKSSSNFIEVENDGHILDESQLFVLGLALINSNNIQDGCERLIASQKLGFQDAYSVFDNLCKGF